MLEDKIIACCKKLRLSRNLADMAMTMDGESHQEYLYKLLVAELRNREQLRTCKRQVFLENSRPIILESFF